MSSGIAGARELVLPFPPSVNRYWRTVRGRTLISLAGRQYRGAAVSAALVGTPVRLGEVPIALHIVAWMPDARRRDVDNLLKAPLDAMAHAGIYADDSQIVALSIRKAGIDRVNPRLEIDVRPAA